MTKAEAKALFRRLIGSYPSANLTDPEVYSASVVSLLCGYPLWAGERAIRKVIDTSKYVPTIAEIRPALEDHVKVHRYAAQWERDADEQRKLLAPPAVPRPTMDELKAKYGPNWGLRGLSDLNAEAKARHDAHIDRANDVAFRRECERAGIDSARGVSPALLATPLMQSAAERYAEIDDERGVG